MGLRINTNLAALSAQRNLFNVTGRLNNSFRRLATGSRISVASDDAAGVAISARLTTRIRSTDQAARNAQDAISLVQVAEGAMGELTDIMARMRELAIQASNGTVNSADAATLDNEFQALISEVDRIAGSTRFNTLNLLNGSISAPVTFQIGADTVSGTDTLGVTFATTTSASLSISAASITTASAASTAIGLIDTALDTVSNFRGDLGAVQNRLDHTIRSLQSTSENLSAANSRIKDVDIASETANLTRDTILQQAAIGILAQANVQPQAALSLLQG